MPKQKVKDAVQRDTREERLRSSKWRNNRTNRVVKKSKSETGEIVYEKAITSQSIMRRGKRLKSSSSKTGEASKRGNIEEPFTSLSLLR